MDEIKTIGYLKYQGKSVENGLLDIRKAANALNGFDEALRFFLCQENPIFIDLEFEIPVRLQKGSWEALIPENIDMFLIKSVAAWTAAKYFGSALGEMAKRDFNDYGFKDLFKSAMKSITWTIKLASHLKSMRINKFENVKFKENNELIGIPNENGEYLFLPKKYLDFYIKCPEYLFSKIVSLVEDDRELEIGVTNSEEKVNVQKVNKDIFVKVSEEDDENILFPELLHGMFIELEGYVTRGNENTNTIGFQYSGHILTCKPAKGSIVDYKTELFSNCIIRGNVDRTDKFGNFIEKKPRINFIELLTKPEDTIKYKELY